MSYTVPTLQESLERARNALRSELPGTDPNVWPNTNYVFAKVWGGLVWELYKFIEWVKRQRFAHSADGDQLDEHGAEYGLTRNPATPAVGTVDIVGTGSHVIAAGTKLERIDGAVFSTLAELTLNSNGSGSVTVQADATGPDSNTVAGTVLTPQEDDADIITVTVDTDGLGAGANTEDDESFRGRILLRKRYPPHGGAIHDYLFWGLSISGVTKVWAESNAYGPGTVGVWFMAHDNGTSNGIPSASLVTSVSDYIESVKPATARVTTLAPTAEAVDIEINLPSDLGPEYATLIDNELTDLFRRAVHVSTPNKPFTLQPNLIWQAVARATGDSRHKVQLPAADITAPTSSIFTKGNVCYV